MYEHCLDLYRDRKIHLPELPSSFSLGSLSRGFELAPKNIDMPRQASQYRQVSPGPIFVLLPLALLARACPSECGQLETFALHISLSIPLLETTAEIHSHLRSKLFDSLLLDFQDHWGKQPATIAGHPVVTIHCS